MEDWTEWLEAKHAELENQKILEGANVVAQQYENHEVHLAIHGAMLAELWEWPQGQLLAQHMAQHEAMFAPENQVTPPEEQNLPANA